MASHSTSAGSCMVGLGTIVFSLYIMLFSKVIMDLVAGYLVSNVLF